MLIQILLKVDIFLFSENESIIGKFRKWKSFIEIDGFEHFVFVVAGKTRNGKKNVRLKIAGNPNTSSCAPRETKYASS